MKFSQFILNQNKLNFFLTKPPLPPPLQIFLKFLFWTKPIVPLCQTLVHTLSCSSNLRQTQCCCCSSKQKSVVQQHNRQVIWDNKKRPSTPIFFGQNFSNFNFLFGQRFFWTQILCSSFVVFSVRRNAHVKDTLLHN